MSRGLVLVLTGVAAVVAIVVLGLTQTKGNNHAPEAGHFDLAAAKRSLAGAPAPLAALHAQASELLPGSTDTVDARIKALKGHPIVVNKWASWCAPCRAEFPIFQRTSVAFGRKVGFLGVLIQDKRPSAERFLRQFPLTYPSVDDAGRNIIGELKALGVPSTAFYDRRGKLAFLHQGVYRNEQDLHRDIQRYLGVS